MSVNYPLDIHQPFDIINYDPITEIYTVLGTAKNIESNKWIQAKVKFGGHKCIFRLKINQLITKNDKRKLRYVRNHLGTKQHNILKKEISEFVVSTHTHYNDT